MKSFTVHFSERSYSEQDGARKVAQACGLEHHELELKPNAEDLITKTADFFDEPFADTSAIPTYLLCEFARKNITVALSGEGGDELFAGYPTYLATRYAPYYRILPGFMKSVIKTLVEQLPVSWERISWDYKLKRFINGADSPPEKSHFMWKVIFTEEEKQDLFDAGFLKEKNGHDGYESFRKIFEALGGGAETEKLLYVDQKTYLLDQFLVKSDRMSMANSLEVRVPILDHRIVEFAAQMPVKYKLRGLTTKWAMRELMKGKLPAEIVKGAKKGFSPPIPFWITGSLKDFMKSNLSHDSIRKTGLLNPDYVEELMNEHFEKKKDHHRKLWAILNFVLWHNRWAGGQNR